MSPHTGRRARHGQLSRILARGRLLAALEREALVTHIGVDGDRLKIHVQDWGGYWQPLVSVADSESSRALKQLHQAWTQYIGSRFHRSLQREYCYRYFLLLERVLAFVGRQRYSAASVRALRMTVGFESFGIGESTPELQRVAAATTTLRNPAYLLARLKWPDVRDDSRFLAVVAPDSDTKSDLFYHYRQHRLAADSSLSLLLYLAAEPGLRSRSYSFLRAFTPVVARGADPFARERARNVWRNVLEPGLFSLGADPVALDALEFVDIGGGSGALAAAIAAQFVDASRAVGHKGPKIRLWSVDLQPGDPARFFGSSRLRRSVDALASIRDDYRTWLARPTSLPSRSGLRIGLVMKVLHGQSTIAICPDRTNVLQGSKDQDTPVDAGEMQHHDPVDCLAPDGAGPGSLSVGARRVRVPGGHAFVQRSLDSYHRAISVSTSGLPVSSERAGASLPIRQFNPDCLVMETGGSVIEALASVCDIVLIEDADLSPAALVSHLAEHELRQVAAYDVAGPLGLRSNYAYVVARRSALQGIPSGERLW